MLKIAYSEAEWERIKEKLITAGLKLITQQGIQHTAVEQQSGISRVFFYFFFQHREDLGCAGVLPAAVKIAGVCARTWGWTECYWESKTSSGTISTAD